MTTPNLVRKIHFIVLPLLQHQHGDAMIRAIAALPLPLVAKFLMRVTPIIGCHHHLHILASRTDPYRTIYSKLFFPERHLQQHHATPVKHLANRLTGRRQLASHDLIPQIDLVPNLLSYSV